ncbi:MAG: hypothetical protein FJ128_05815 [Deltaproteobacteria bacterium]|nr:hypothetical protein [Deltaproteobacteria bacterium]
MKPASSGTCSAVLAILCSALLWCGCAAQGYIVTSVQSVLGLDVSENPKTQVPHVRFGFARSQYYYIPTGKSDSGQGAPSSGNAKETPELVSEIVVDVKFLQSAYIKERFAVGPTAVQADAARALFNPEGKALPPRPENVNRLIREIGALIQEPAQREKARSWIKQHHPQSPSDPDRFLDNFPNPGALEKLKAHLTAT